MGTPVFSTMASKSDMKSEDLGYVRGAKRYTFNKERQHFAHPDQLRHHSIPIHARDFCAHLLIPLNQCRRKTKFAWYECDTERHAFEKCRYVEHLRAIKRKLDGED